MNASTLSRRLDTCCRALDAGMSERLADDAQQRLEARLATARRQPAARRWIGVLAAGAACCLVLALALLPANRSSAFAAAQQRLRDFSTLSLTIEQRSRGMALPPIHVRMNRAGDVRTDLGTATSIVVSPRSGAMLTLLHGPRRAIRMPLAGARAGNPADKLVWLDAIRRFQGQARPLPGHRFIDGRRTTGWALDTEGMHIELWADKEGLPLAIDIDGGIVLSQRMKVAVDAPIDPAVFSTDIPPGYAAMQADQD